MTDIATLSADNIDIWTGAIQRKSSAGRGGGKRIGLYGIDRLRALILDLAVRGKLVQGYVAAKQGCLGDAGDWVSGNAFPKQFQGEVGGEIPFLKVSDMNLPGNERVMTEANNYVSVDQLRALRAKLHPAGTIIFPKIGGAIATNKRRILGDQSAMDNNCAGQVPAKNVDVDWLYMVLTSIDMTAYQSGTSVPALNMKRLAQHPLAIPNLAEQRRIVAKVDELMALCDALERESTNGIAAHQEMVETLLDTLVNSADAADLARQWARLESYFDTLFTTDLSIDALKQCILDLAVRGKLVERDTPSLEKWVELPLEKLIGPMDSGWSPACHEHPSTSDGVWGVLKTTAVQDMRYDAEQNKELPAKFEPRPDAEVRVGDVLITRAGPTNRVGICCFVASTRPRLMISDKIIRFRPISSIIEGAFLALALSVGKSAQQIEKAKSGMAASQVNISQSKLKAIIVPVPPLAEQSRIIANVDALMALCDALKACLADTAQTQRHLADVITERAAA